MTEQCLVRVRSPGGGDVFALYSKVFKIIFYDRTVFGSCQIARRWWSICLVYSCVSRNVYLKVCWGNFIIDKEGGSTNSCFFKFNDCSITSHLLSRIQDQDPIRIVWVYFCIDLIICRIYEYNSCHWDLVLSLLNYF